MLVNVYKGNSGFLTPQDDPALPEVNFPHAARWRTEFIETNGVRERSPYEDSRQTEHM